MPEQRPNILLLFADQHRGDALGCAGNPAIRTPNLDALAAGGVRFSHAVTPVPVCVAARYSLITGRRCRDHHWVANSKLPGAAPELPTLMTSLGAAGYHTHGIGKFHFQPQGRHHGFFGMEWMEEIPRYRENDHYLQYLQRVGWGHKREVHGVRNLLYQQPQTTEVPEEHVGSTWVADRAVEFIRCYRRREPFFLWASWIAPHPPWNVPRPWDEMYRLDDMPAPIDYDRPLADLPPICRGLRQLANTEHASEARLRRTTALYYAQCSLIDKGVGRILAELDRRGMAENTLILYTSDHGELLNDHGLCQKSTPFDGCARVPLLVRWPRRLRPGQVREDYATLLDVLPTCLDAASEAHPDPHSLAGRSLLRDDPPRDEVVIEHGSAPRRWLSLRDRRYKFNAWMENGFEELYDLAADPRETRNLVRELPDAAAHYRRKLVEWEREHGFPGSLDGDRFRVTPVGPSARPLRNAQFPTWVANLPPDELARMETPGEAVARAIARETTYSLEELDLRAWKDAGGDLRGTPFEEAWRRA
ncbi:MAG: sulfatase-like hydrolase/transferase [Armatimonadetes bacterium]|nr:sulfatase-like hydrolase/transferase [Armatimonadota bacterium]